MVDIQALVFDWGDDVIRVSSHDEDIRQEVMKRLRRYRSKVAEYQACKELYDSLYPSGTGQLTDMPPAKSDTYEPERWAQRRWDQSARMQESLDGMRDAIEDIEKLVDLLEGDQKTVLVRRYLLNQSYEQIAVKMNYCERQIYRMHDKAIGKLMSVNVSK